MFADTLVWKELRTTGQKFIPRAGHTTVALRKHLFVFGGFTDDRRLFDDLHVLNVGMYSLLSCLKHTYVSWSPTFSVDSTNLEGLLCYLRVYLYD